MLDLGQQAAIVGYKDAIAKGQQAYDATAGGVTFRVHLDKDTGRVTIFATNQNVYSFLRPTPPTVIIGYFIGLTFTMDMK
ncbi:hypothetical protein [Citrobacter portucalensis]|uniref:hypothetical protein n=1 Tax=Citrobacter portucalensis TaxID=1639133 RepID=UPI003B43477C